MHLRVSLYLFSCICEIGASRVNLAKIRQIMGRDSQKVIQSVKFQISHQMKPYLSVRTIYGSSYTYFSIFGELGQVGEIGPNYPKSWALIRRKSFIVLNFTFHIKWSHNHLNSISGSIYTYSCVFEKLGQVRKICHKYPKSSKVLNSTVHIKWSLSQG